MRIYANVYESVQISLLSQLINYCEIIYERLESGVCKNIYGERPITIIIIASFTL